MLYLYINLFSIYLNLALHKILLSLCVTKLRISHLKRERKIIIIDQLYNNCEHNMIMWSHKSYGI